MDSILAYLSVSDLKSCRLVSSQYNEIACKALQREETVTFKNISQLETYLSKIKPVSLLHHSAQCSSMSLCSDLSSLPAEWYEEEEEEEEDEELKHFGGESETDHEDNRSESCEWSQCSPAAAAAAVNVEDNLSLWYHLREGTHHHNSQFYQYSHRSFHFDYCDPSEEIEPIDQFFAMFGPQIQRLKYTTDLLPYNFPKTVGHMGEVWQDRLCSLEELILEMKWGVPAYLFPTRIPEGDPRRHRVLLPSLRKLHLDVLLTDRDADRAELFIHQLLSVTPNIEEISIPGSKRFFDDYINVVLARAIIASEVPRLSVLNFCLALSDAQMRLLTGRNLPLSTLILDLEDLQFGDGNNMEQDGNDVDLPHNHDNNGGVIDGDDIVVDNLEVDHIRQEFLRQNQNNRRPSFTPIVKSTLQRFLSSLSATLSSLHICFPQSPRHNLHTFRFQQEMTELKFLALGYFAGSAQILDQLPALKKLELWNVQFRDCPLGHGKVVPDKYQGITSVIS